MPYIHVVFRGKVKVKELKKRRKYLPKSEAEKKKHRVISKQCMRRYREKMRDTYRERREIDNARCTELPRIMARCVEDPDRPGCLIWKGAWKVVRNSVQPTMTAGMLGAMNARRAMWLALDRPGLVARFFVIASCGNEDCLAPDHLVLTNLTLENAKKKAKRMGIAP